VHIEYMRDTSKEMPIIENPLEVKSMTIWHCKYLSFSQISKCTNLEQLNIVTLPENDFEFLSKCCNLKFLSITHLPNITCLDALAGLTELETLSLSTLPSWDSSGKKTTVHSLEPLANLPKLKFVELFGVVPELVSLESLGTLQNLESVRFSKYPKKVVNQFYKLYGVSDNWAPEFEVAN
jgi:Leucine-rich repeat (LRR) protein